MNQQRIIKDNGTTHTLINADFFDVTLADIEGKPIADLILTDPPFNTTNAKWDSPLDLDEMWGRLPLFKYDNTPVLLFAQTPFDKVLGCSNIKKLKYEWIWEKTSATGHFNAKKMPMKAHENILVFYDKLPKYNPQKTEGHIKKEAFKRKTLDCELYGDNTQDVFYSSTDRYPRDVLKFSSDKQKLNLHSTQKPIELLRYFIRTYTEKGDTVLDFTAGSCSLAVAAYLEGRNSVCIEKDKDFYQKGVSWVKGCSEGSIYNLEEEDSE